MDNTPVEASVDPVLYQRIMSLIFGAILSKSVYVAAKLGIADELAEGPLSVDELAERTETSPDALYRLLRALAGEGLFEEVGPRVFSVTELGRLISEDAPGSRKYLSLMFAEQTDPLFEHILDSIRTGEPVATKALGKPYFDWLGDHREASEVFNKAMSSGATARLPTLLPLPLWETASRVVDVGGGNGTAVVALLTRYPHLHGVVFDLPHIREEAEATLAAAGLTDRSAFVGGSFFESVPEDGDVYVLLQILHDWSDDEATRILHTVRKAMGEDDRLVVLELIVPDEEGPHPSVLLDLLMLVQLGGRERTESEWRKLLTDGGFEVERISSEERASAIEARPV
jgi:DNA-binding transcriptional ArsR family regulator